MKSFRKITIVAAAGFLLAGSPVWGQVSPPEERVATLEKAERFAVVVPEDVEGRFAEAINPFAPDAPQVESGETVTEAPQPEAEKLPEDKEVLAAIANQLTPSGVMQFGSRVILLFGERRVSVGDFIPVSYQGREYRVQMASASSRSFTLRLNNETFTKRIQ